MRMQLSSLVVALCLTGSGAANQHSRRADGTLPVTEDTATPKKFILEFAEGVDPTEAVNSITSSSNAKILKVFNSDVFRGASVESLDDNVDSFQALQGVQQAWTGRRIELSPLPPQRVYAAGEDTTGYDIHYMTGVDKLHELGIYGKGVKVGIVDTGISYKHPALGGGIGPGFKIAGGYDFVGDGEWPTVGSKEPDEDPQDYRGHGTHVAGIVAGKSEFFTGVAPEATLYAYKVFTQGSTDEDTLIDAFLRAYEDGVDIITASIGGLNGWTNGPWAVVSSRLVEQGVVVTISAGNDGEYGPFAGSSGSSGDNVLAIASVDASTLGAPPFRLNIEKDGKTDTTSEPYNAVDDWSNGAANGLPIVPLGFDTTIVDDACSPLPASAPDFTGKIALVRRGTCTFAIKQANLEARNAKYIIFYTNAQPLTSPSTDSKKSTLAMITAEAGQKIVDAVKAGATATGNFTLGPNDGVLGIKNPYGGVASSFTSIGPTNELAIKPDVAAPGGAIYSTYLNDGYAVLSGTSMACPYVAGVAALYIGKFGGRSTHGAGFAKNLAARILTSGESIKWDDGARSGIDYGTFASVAQVGTGLINATKVLSFDTQLSFAKFALNDTHHFSRYHSVDVTNTGKSPVTYTFELQASGGFNSFVRDLPAGQTPRVAVYEEIISKPQKWAPEVTFPSSFTLAPGESKTAKFSFNYPKGLDASLLPVYSGKVLIKGSNGETVGVPYLGLGADLHKDLGDMFQYATGQPNLTSTPADIPVSKKATFTFDLSKDAQDFPHIYEKLAYATPQLRWDIFEESWTERKWAYPPVVGQAGYIGSATAWAGSTAKGYFDPATDNATALIAFPQTYLPRDPVTEPGQRFWWFGRFANGTQIAPGKYKFRFAALVPFGTPQNADNWDVFQTPTIEVLPLKK